MPIEINRIKDNSSPYSSPSSDEGKKAVFKSNPIPQDKVEISSKKKELSNVSKIGMGLGIAAIIGLGAELIFGKGQHIKTIWNKITGKSVETAKTYIENIEKLQEYFNKIFNKNFTKDEANEMALKYQEAFKEEKDLDFLSKLFNQLNKDYELPLKTVQSQTSVELGSEKVYGRFSALRGIKADGTLTPGGMSFNSDKLVDNFDRKGLVRVFAHELKHAQQMKIGLGADKRRFLENDAIKNINHPWYTEALRVRGGNKELAMDDYIQKIESTLLLPEFRNVEKIETSSPLYQRGLDYIESWKNYVTSAENDNLYRTQLVEKEAFEVGDKFVEIFEMLTK